MYSRKSGGTTCSSPQTGRTQRNAFFVCGVRPPGLYQKLVPGAAVVQYNFQRLQALVLDKHIVQIYGFGLTNVTFSLGLGSKKGGLVYVTFIYSDRITQYMRRLLRYVA